MHDAEQASRLRPLNGGTLLQAVQYADAIVPAAVRCPPALAALPHGPDLAAAARLPWPVGPVPLLPEDADVPMERHAAVPACVDLVGYAQLLDYTNPALSPACTAEDAAWADDLLCTAGYRRTPTE